MLGLEFPAPLIWKGRIDDKIAIVNIMILWVFIFDIVFLLNSLKMINTHLHMSFNGKRCLIVMSHVKKHISSDMLAAKITLGFVIMSRLFVIGFSFRLFQKAVAQKIFLGGDMWEILDAYRNYDTH